jgi:hypothetical protein
MDPMESEVNYDMIDEEIEVANQKVEKCNEYIDLLTKKFGTGFDFVTGTLFAAIAVKDSDELRRDRIKRGNPKYMQMGLTLAEAKLFTAIAKGNARELVDVYGMYSDKIMFDYAAPGTSLKRALKVQPKRVEDVEKLKKTEVVDQTKEATGVERLEKTEVVDQTKEATGVERLGKAEGVDQRNQTKEKPPPAHPLDTEDIRSEIRKYLSSAFTSKSMKRAVHKIEAAFSADRDAFTPWLSHGEDVDRSPLHLAATDGQLGAIMCLLQKGTEVDINEKTTVRRCLHVFYSK